MWIGRLLLATTWLAACCTPTEAQKRADRAPKTFVKALSDDPSSIYFYLKRSFEADDAKEAQRLRSEGVNDRYIGYGRSAKDNAIGIGLCEGAVVQRQFDTMGSRRLEDLADLAHLVLFVKGAFVEYPANVWKDKLTAYEEQELKRIGSGKRPSGNAEEQVLGELAKAAQEYRKTHPILPAISPRAQECGEGSSARDRVQILPEGDFKRIQYANVRAYGFCDEAHSDATARDACAGWRDAAGTQKLIGNYKVRITWVDGSKQEFDLAVDQLESESDGVKRPRYKRSN